MTNHFSPPVSARAFVERPEVERTPVNTAKENLMPGVFVVAVVGKAIAFIIIVLILAVIGLFTLLKKAV